MINNPYSDINDDDGVPLTPISSPEPINGDRGEPTTKSPKKRKTGMMFAILGVAVGAIVAVGMFGYFFYNAVSKSAPANVVSAPDPALAPRVSDAQDLGQFKEKVRKNNEVAEQRRRDAQLEAAKQAAAAQISAENAASNDAQNTAPSRGRYAGQPQNGSASNRGADQSDLSPKEVADARKFEGDVLWNGGGHDSDNSELSSGQSAGQLGGRAQNTRPAAMSAEERLRLNPLYAQSMSQGGVAGGIDDEDSGSSSNSISNLLKTEKTAKGTVSARPDLKFLLINGTNIPCTLIPRIVTDYPATIRCMVNRDVYSADGSLLLIAKGSVTRGERKVSLQQGQSMVFASWSTIDTTDGLEINVDSMAADNLGAAGIKGIIDNHYGQRFGGAILLSFLDDVFKAVGKSNSTTNGVNFDSSTENAQDMASIALQQSINIPPTGYVQHATELNIIVARDIDFRSIYGVN